MLPVLDHKPANFGALGVRLDAKAGRGAARDAPLGALASAVSLATSGDFVDHPKLLMAPQIIFEMSSV